MKKISLIGCGNIGSQIAQAIDKKIIPAELIAIYDRIRQRSKKLKSKLKNQQPKICNSIKEAINGCDLVVECASQEAVKEISEFALPSGKEIFVMSVGALVTYPEIDRLAKKYNCKIYFPSGAIAGLNGIRALAVAKNKIKSIILTTRKPPKALGMKLKVKKAKVVFDGTAEDAVKKFPANINVSAALALAGIGVKRTKVKIVADPNVKMNIHEIEVVSAAGKITTKTENVPSKENPKTSYLAVLSAIAELLSLCSEERK
ncbi:MAG: aspartate dehydrogenase [Elusimicrobiota bacterium]|nr:aspartate dehydrogenase [Elusimicrobiota bacterium]